MLSWRRSNAYGIHWPWLCLCLQRLIDAGRLHFVREQLGLQAELVEDCDEDLSPENTLLLAWRPAGITSVAARPALAC